MNNQHLISKFTFITAIKKLVIMFLITILTFSLSGCVIGGEDDDSTTTPPSTEQGKYSQYSELLQNLLKDDEVNSLIDRFQANSASVSKYYFTGIPFSFVEKQDHSIEKIKSGEYDCITRTIIKDNEPNNLYMSICVENAGEYYTNYMVKYTLTEKEIADYKMLHGVRGDWYYQAMFMNDAISKTKIPTILSKTNITIEAHNNLDSLQGVAGLNSTKKIMGTNSVNVILKDFDVKTQTFNVYVFNSVASSQKTNIKGKFTTIPYSRGNERVYAPNGVMLRPSQWGKFTDHISFTLDWLTEEVEIFETYNVFVVKEYCTDLRDEIK